MNIFERFLIGLGLTNGEMEVSTPEPSLEPRYPAADMALIISRFEDKQINRNEKHNVKMIDEISNISYKRASIAALDHHSPDTQPVTTVIKHHLRDPCVSLWSTFDDIDPLMAYMNDEEDCDTCWI